MLSSWLLINLSITLLDLIALAFLVLTWIVYVIFAAWRARITSYAGVNFNNGPRAHYFALAAMAWFLHPWLMMAATARVAIILYHREFSSRTLKALIEEDTSPTLGSELFRPRMMAAKHCGA